MKRQNIFQKNIHRSVNYLKLDVNVSNFIRLLLNFQNKSRSFVFQI